MNFRIQVIKLYYTKPLSKVVMAICEILTVEPTNVN